MKVVNCFIQANCYKVVTIDIVKNSKEVAEKDFLSSKILLMTDKSINSSIQFHSIHLLFNSTNIY